jgi:hypothetical protein
MKSSRIPLLSILFLALAVRLIALRINYNNLDFAESFFQQGETAHNILAGRSITQSTEHLSKALELSHSQHRLVDFEDVPSSAIETVHADYNNEPGYGIFLAMLWKITSSERWIYPRLLQILIDVIMCYIMFLVPSQLFSRQVGYCSAAFYAVFIPQIEMAIRPYRDAWVSFLFIVSLLYLFSIKKNETPFSRKILLTICMGVFIAVVCWMRSTVLLYTIALVAGMYFLIPKRQWVQLSMVLILAFGAVYAPFILRSQKDFDKPMATRGAFWHSFWGGIGQFPNPYGVVEDDVKIYEFGKSLDSTITFNSDSYEQVLKKKAMELLREHPFFYATTIVRRGAVVIFPRLGREVFFQRQLNEGKTGAMNQTGAAGKWLLIVIDGCLGALFLYGVWLKRSEFSTLAILIIPFVYTIATLSPFYVTGRNIANAYCSEIIFASAGLVFIVQHTFRFQRSN